MKMLLVWARQFATVCTRHCAAASLITEVLEDSRTGLVIGHVPVAEPNSELASPCAAQCVHRGNVGVTTGAKDFVRSLESIRITQKARGFNKPVVNLAGASFKLLDHNGLRALIAELVDGGLPQEVQP